MPRKPNILRTIGRTGLNYWDGRVAEEFLRELSGDRGIKIYREMRDNDPICGGVMFAIENLIRRVSWRIDPASDSPEHVRDADFIRSTVYDMANTWTGTLSEMLTHLTFGWAYLEIEYKRRLGYNRAPHLSSKYNDGLIGWARWSLRSQDTLSRWVFDDEGHVLGMVQNAPPDYKDRYIPIEKAIHLTTTDAKQNPEGRSIFRNAYRPWYFKTVIEQIEGIGVERDLAGLPVIRAPYDIFKLAEQGDQNAIDVLTDLKKIATNIKRDEQEGLVIPSYYQEGSSKDMFGIELLSSAGNRQFPTNEIIQRKNLEIAMTVLGDFLMLGHQKYGSYALGVSKVEIFEEAISAWLDNIAAPVNNRVIPELLRLNGRPVENIPQLAHTDVRSIDLPVLVDSIVKLSGAGFNTLESEDVKRFLMAQMQLPYEADQSLEEK